MYIMTGGAGFIGSAMLAKLNAEGIFDIMVVDDMGSGETWKNLSGKRIADYVQKDDFLQMMADKKMPERIEAIIHLGACSATTERNVEYLMKNNYYYSKEVTEYAVKKAIRLIYASSGATYGDGEFGFTDEDSRFKTLRPTNPYGYSKHLHDIYVLHNKHNIKVAGLKFFNVYGPNEYHKGDMASVVYKAYHQAKQTGKIKLFRSYHRDFQDGEQKRDFVYVKDCCNVMWWLLKNPRTNGIYNLGSGQARSWNDLARAVFAALDKPAMVEYIDMPDQLQGQYQYFTQAEMGKLRDTKCPLPSTSLEDGVRDYICNYLEKVNPYL